MKHVGLSSETTPTLNAAIMQFAQLTNSFDKPQYTAEAVCDTCTEALIAAGLLMDFVATFGVEPARFIDLARHQREEGELHAAIYTYITEKE